jgi:hypothetical protein
MRKLPTARSILWTDNVCYTLTVIAPVCFVLALMVKLTGTVPGGRGKPDQPIDPQSATLILAGATALVLLLSAIVAARVARIRRLFDQGEEVEATVVKVSRFRGGGKLRLEFERAGTTYKVRSTYQRWARTPTFTEGTRIAVLVDRLNPKRAVPVALYADPGTPPAGSRVASASVEHRSASRTAPEGFGLQLGSGTSQPARTGDDR